MTKVSEWLIKIRSWIQISSKMRNKNKMIKFKKVTNMNPSQQNNLIGFYEQSSIPNNKKAEMKKQPYPKHKVIIQPQLMQKQADPQLKNKLMILKKKQRHEMQQVDSFQYEELQINKEKKLDRVQNDKQERMSYDNLQREMVFSQYEQLGMSPYIEKRPTIKLAIPKGYKIQQPIENITNQLIRNLSSTQSIISVEDIFSVQLLKNIMGLYSESDKNINFVGHQTKSIQQESLHNQKLSPQSPLQLSNFQHQYIQESLHSPNSSSQQSSLYQQYQYPFQDNYHLNFIQSETYQNQYFQPNQVQYFQSKQKKYIQPTEKPYFEPPEKRHFKQKEKPYLQPTENQYFNTQFLIPQQFEYIGQQNQRLNAFNNFPYPSKF